MPKTKSITMRWGIMLTIDDHSDFLPALRQAAMTSASGWCCVPWMPAERSTTCWSANSSSRRSVSNSASCMPVSALALRRSPRRVASATTGMAMTSASPIRQLNASVTIATDIVPLTAMPDAVACALPPNQPSGSRTIWSASRPCISRMTSTVTANEWFEESTTKTAFI